MKKDVHTYVSELLTGSAGHGMGHVTRVVELSMLFADSEKADKSIVELAAYLHDVDDYKLFNTSTSLDNANAILDNLKVSYDSKVRVLDIISTMGYNNYLDGIRPNTIEGMVVSDADMCDAIGAQGILRTYSYSLSKGLPFFDKNILPKEYNISADEYRHRKNNHSVQHFFDKLLLIPHIMMTKSGREEAVKRQKIMVDFLRAVFVEANATIWLDFLDEFILGEDK